MGACSAEKTFEFRPTQTLDRGNNLSRVNTSDLWPANNFQVADPTPLASSSAPHFSTWTLHRNTLIFHYRRSTHNSSLPTLKLITSAPHLNPRTLLSNTSALERMRWVDHTSLTALHYSSSAPDFNSRTLNSRTSTLRIMRLVPHSSWSTFLSRTTTP